MFDVAGCAFCLVPGGPVQLGFDEQAWAPTEEEMASFLRDPQALDLFATSVPQPWQAPDWTAEELADIRAHLATRTTRPRQTTVATLLAAVDAQEAGVTEASLDHPLIQAILAEQPQRVEGTHIVDMFKPDEDATTYGRVRYNQAGRPVQAWLAAHTTYHGVVTDLAQRGLRLLDPDEWEHAVAFGGQTLFPWGDRCPDRQTDTTIGTPDGAWFDSTQPKLSGLHIAENPYHLELTIDPAQVRGGDAGGAEHGGDTWFHAWLPHAPAYHDPAQGRHNLERAGMRRMWVRPALPVN